ncbi:flavin oxidoreductase [Mycolicibacterium setense]|uniref:flavin reductase family protein n=1 Tax=Mycolicibacterium setense TaxID=431269 RepID=UPI0007EBC425|nr:flavin reductase family protein [Mycolicibacterium setense]OBB17699.1 flavin oxidoreductase [Mycolicibacterium setense]
MTISADCYRSTMRRHPAGVTVITLMSPSGPVGFTATSFASLSLDPPLISFNVTHTSSSIAAIREAKSVVVHLLGEHQLDIAQRFSRSVEQRFDDQSHWTTIETGEPLLGGTPTWLRAKMHRLIETGDSTLVIGEVTRTHLSDEMPGVPAPLIFHGGCYHRVRPILRG